jgi:TRAP-type C4-dicarboxylate transport system permease large subunit
MRQKIASLVLLLPMGLLFVLVIGGILAGYFTPGEGGAVGAMGSFIYALARRKINFHILKSALTATAIMSGKIFMIFAGVYCFGAFLSASRLPIVLASTVVSMEISRYAILLVVILMYIILGSIMNIMPMMLLTLPTIYPTIMAMGFDGIWFGVITVMLMEMGMITPPVGIIVFTLSSLVPDIPMATIFKGVLPFVVAMLGAILIIIAFPQIALFLPNTFM